DYVARVEGAQARVEIGDTAGAVKDLTDIATELEERSRPAEAIDALRVAAKLQPDDEAIRTRLFKSFLAADDFAHAREFARTVVELRTIAELLDLHGRHDEALDVVRLAAKLDPHDVELKTYLARAFVARGDLVSAAEYLTLESAGDDPQL